MNWFHGLTFKWKLAFPLLLVSAIFLLGSTLSILASNQLSNNADKVGNIYFKQLDNLLQADRDLYQALVAERTLVYINTRDQVQIAAHKENLQQAKSRVNEAITLGHIDDSNVQNEFNRYYQAWFDLSNKVVQLATQGDQQRAVELTKNESQKAFDKLRDLIDVVQEAQIEKANHSTQLAIDNGKTIQHRLILFTLAGIAICIATIMLFPPLVSKPLTVFTKQMDEMAHGEGDLKTKFKVENHDEIGLLAEKFNLFLEQMHSMVAHIKTNAKQVEGASDNLHTIAETNKHAIFYQNKALDMVVSAVEEMSIAIREVAENTTKTADQAETAHNLSEQGFATVNETAIRIREVSSQLNEASTIITQLEQEAAGVTSVLEVIRGIAEQTNLLALNAAIEAARAGEQGRGFAVVADEVRTLASRTQESTKDIRDMLEKLQSGVQSAVSVMAKSSSSSEDTVVVANKAGAALDEINQAVKLIAEMSSQVATAVEEQSTVIEDINRNLVEIHDQSNTTSDNAEKTSIAGSEMKQASEELLETVGRFRV